MKVITIINVDYVYSKVSSKTLKYSYSKLNTHKVFEFDKSNTRLLVKEMVNPIKVWLAEKFRWCDCGKFLKLHISCCMPTRTSILCTCWVKWIKSTTIWFMILDTKITSQHMKVHKFVSIQQQQKKSKSHSKSSKTEMNIKK